MTRPPPTPLSAASTAVPPPPESANVESDFVIILAALLCALMCMVGLLAVVRCTCLRRAAGGDRLPPTSSSSSTASRNANKGLRKKVVQSLPKFTYSSSSSAGPGSKIAAECSICLADFAEGDEVRVLPQCGHGFHVACIDTWLGSHSSCPSCRQVLAVGRCRKCGGLPMTRGGGSELGPAEAELKRIEDAELANRNSESFLP